MVEKSKYCFVPVFEVTLSIVNRIIFGDNMIIEMMNDFLMVIVPCDLFIVDLRLSNTK